MIFMLLGMVALMALFSGDLFGSGSSESESSNERNRVEDLGNPNIDDDSVVIEELGTPTLTNTDIWITDNNSDEPLSWDAPHDGELTTAERVDNIEANSERDIDTRDDFETYVEEVVMPNFSGDLVAGSDGSDRIFGTNGDDIGIGWRGDDRIFLRDGDDQLVARFAAESGGDDFIRGGDGNDTLVDHLGNDTLRGDANDDHLDARDHHLDRGADLVIGGVGNDLLVGDDGDTLDGGPGNDRFEVFAQAGSPEPVTITDYDPDDDSLLVLVETANPKGSAEYSINLVSSGPNTQVSVDGQLVAVLENIAPGNVGGIAVGNYRIS